MKTRIRALTASGALLAATLLGTSILTAALSIAAADAVVAMTAGSAHDYDLQVAASADPAWVPTADDWADANPAPLVVDPDIARDGSAAYAIAVRNTSPRLVSALCLSVSPGESLASTEAAAGSRDDAFSLLRVTLTDADGPLFRDERVTARPTACAARPLAPGGVRMLALRIDGATEPTHIRLRVDGESR